MQPVVQAATGAVVLVVVVEEVVEVVDELIKTPDLSQSLKSAIKQSQHLTA